MIMSVESRVIKIHRLPNAITSLSRLSYSIPICKTNISQWSPSNSRFGTLPRRNHQKTAFIQWHSNSLNRGQLNKLRVAFDKPYSTEISKDISSSIKVAERKLFINESCIISKIQDNIRIEDASGIGLNSGAFIGADFSEEKCRHVVSLGIFKDARFLSLFRFKLWWMAQKMGSKGSEVPIETQFMVAEIKAKPDAQVGYAVFLPLLEGSFRASLQGNDKDQLELCLESGDPAIKTSSFQKSLLVNTGSDPFQVITNAIRALELHLKTFQHRDKKKIPGIVDWFGWCTWDAFYTDVTERGVEEGLKSLSDGGTPPRFVIIDDGWQSVVSDKEEESKENSLVKRLTNIKENYKFGKDRKEQSQDVPTEGIKHIVDIAKKNYNLIYVYVWHAITGYWGGVRPDVNETRHFESQMKYPSPSPGILSNEPGMYTDVLTTQGVGLVSPKKVFEFYNELHSYLASAGIDGVKVDVQCILETLGSGLGGRVALTKQYHQALDASIASNFPENGCIACMSHNTDALYCSKQTAVVRASDDFYPKDPVTHTIHIASVAYNSIFLGEFMLPDWDMFHSVHPAAEYHAAARSIGGCPIYVSDMPGTHDFNLLKKLVLPDGSILRATLPGRPTIDCLFADPTRDGKSLLKIWNMNKCTGVLGVFNCQGAAWSNVDKKNVFHEPPSKALSGSIKADEVCLLAQVAHEDWNGDCSIYSHSGNLVHVPKNEELPVTLKVLQYDIYTITPIKKLKGRISFAPIGLIDMFNPGGAIIGVDYEAKKEGSKDTTSVNMTIRGSGRVGAYSSLKPASCHIDDSPLDFSYDDSSGLLTFALPFSSQEGQFWNVSIHF